MKSSESTESLEVNDGNEIVEETAQEIEEEVIDPNQFLDPVNVLDKLPKNFYDDLLSKKWTERKEALEALLVLLSFPKIEDGRYSELVSALSKRVQSDSNVVVVTLSVQSIEKLARGIGSQFSIYQSIVVGSLLERCKEKKQTVVDAIKLALDAVFLSTLLLNDINDEVFTTMTHKNPQVKLEGVQFLIRSIQVTKKVPAKAEIKLLSENLVKLIDDADGGIRESATEALGTLMRLVGERPMAALIDKVDASRAVKIKEYFTTAQVKLAGATKPQVNI